MIFWHYLDLAWYFRKLVARIVVISTAAALLFTMVNLLTEPRYTAAVSVTYLPTSAELGFTRESVGGTQDSRANILAQTLIEYLLSRPVLEATLAELNKKHPTSAEPQVVSGFTALLAGIKENIRKIKSLIKYGQDFPPDGHEVKVRNFRNSISLSAVEGSYILRIEVTSDDPEMASDAANGLAQAFSQRAARESERQSKQLIEFYENEIAETQRALDDVLRKEGALTRQGQAMTSTLGLEQERYLRVRSELEQIETRLAYLDRTSIQDADRERWLLNSRHDQLRDSEAMHRQAIASISARLTDYQEPGQTLIDLALERQQLSEQIRDFRTSMNGVRIRSSGIYSPVQIIEPALPPLSPANTSIPKGAVFGFTAGLLFSAIALLILELLSSRVRTAVDLQRITGERFIGRLDRRVAHAAGGPSGPSGPEAATLGVRARSFVPSAVWPGAQPGRELRRFAETAERNLATLGHLEHGRLAVTGLSSDGLVADTARALFLSFSDLGLPLSWTDTTRQGSGGNQAGSQPPSEAAEPTGRSARSSGHERAAKAPGSGGIEVVHLDPIGGRFNWKRAAELASAMVCIVPAGEVEEDTIHQVIDSANRNGISDLSFVLLSR